MSDGVVIFSGINAINCLSSAQLEFRKSQFKEGRELPHWSSSINDISNNELNLIDFDLNLNFISKMKEWQFSTGGHFVLLTAIRYEWVESIFTPRESSKDFGRFSEVVAKEILELRKSGRLTVIGLPKTENKHSVSVSIVIELAKLIDLKPKLRFNVMCKQKIIYVAKDYFNKIRRISPEIKIIGVQPTFKNFEDDYYYVKDLTETSSKIECPIYNNIRFVDENNVKRRIQRNAKEDTLTFYFQNKQHIQNGMNLSCSVEGTDIHNYSTFLAYSKSFNLNDHQANHKSMSVGIFEIQVPLIDDCADIAIIIAMADYDTKLPVDVFFEVRSKDKIFEAAKTYFSLMYKRNIYLPDIEHN